MLRCFNLIFVIILSNAMSTLTISSPSALTGEVGQDVVFMFNATKRIDAFNWGIRDGNTNNLKQGLINYDIQAGMKLDDKINSSSYAGRVSFVGDLTKNQAWFKITNLNINDTNQYTAKIFTQGSSGYTNLHVRLTVIMPSTSPQPTTLSSLKSSLPSTQHWTTLPTFKPKTLTNLTTSVEVEEIFSEDMKEVASFSFKNFAKRFKIAVSDAYTKESNFKNVTVISLRKGSIIVTFTLFFESELDYDKACAPLEKEIEDGKLGSLEIVPGSLKCSKQKHDEDWIRGGYDVVERKQLVKMKTCSDGAPSPQSPPGSGTGVHPGIIAGVAVAGVLAVVGLIIAILFVCRKKSSRKDYRSSTSGQGYEIDARYREPEEQYASVQRPDASGGKQSNNQQLPQYAAVDKSKKTKKNTRDPNELVYADLDHNASMDMRPPSVQRPDSGSDTVYADIQSGRQKPQYPPPQYGNILDISHA